jgi:hypothetical protein
MQPKQSLAIQLTSLPGCEVKTGDILLDIKLFTRGSFRYQFKAGRTDAKGKLSITYADLEFQRASNAKLFLMDYNTPLTDCDPLVEISIPSDRELKIASEYVEQNFGTVPTWATPWPSNAIVEGLPQKVTLTSDTTSVSYPVSSPHG